MMGLWEQMENPNKVIFDVDRFKKVPDEVFFRWLRIKIGSFERKQLPHNRLNTVLGKTIEDQKGH